MTAVAVTAPKHPLVLGKPIRHRTLQQAAWTGLSILLGAGFIAGLYWIFLQQDYHHLGLPFGSAKTWWDNGMGIIRSGRWPRYRHGVRDGGEPALWVLVGATILGKAKTENVRLMPTWSLAPAAAALIAAIVGGTLGITWLTAFGPLSRVADTLSWQQLILGIALGRVLHYAWAPFGATIRYRIVARSAFGTGVPLWVQYPLLPPAWREMWSELRALRPGSGTKADRDLGTRALISAMVTVFLLVAVIGDLAKFAVAHGVHIPVMFP